MKKLYAILLLLTCCNVTFAQTLDKKYYVTDGNVSDVVLHGNTIYLGGAFNTVGPNTGHAALLNAAGEWDAAMPVVNGEVDAIVADGSGGWYIGGSFDHVEDVPVVNLVHIKANKTLDVAFAPKPSIRVRSLVVYNNTLYVGGDFFNIAGQAKQHAAAFDIATGALLPWNPQPDGFVSNMITDKGVIYMLGNFFNVGGKVRINLAGVDAVTGVATSLEVTQNSSSGIGAMALLNDTMYVGGNFTKLNGETRIELGAVDIKTNLVTSWAPTADNAISFMYAAGNKIFVSGAFDIANGANHLGVAAFDAVTGVVSPWNANVIGYGAVGGNILSMLTHGDTLYVAGHFKSIGGQLRNNVAAIDINTGLATNWDPQANANAYVVAPSGSQFYIGGDFTSANTVYRTNIAALNATTGKVTNWYPVLDGNVHGMAVKGDTVIVSGEFFKIGDSARVWMGSIDSTTGLATSWYPKVFGRVYSIDVANNLIYVAGTFSQISGVDKYDIAALDPKTAAATPWSVDINESLNTVLNGIKVSGNKAYIWGSFNAIGADTRNNLAAVDTSTGKATAWAPNPNSPVYALNIQGSNIYVGGSFTNIGGENRNGIARLNSADGKAQPWDPNITGSYVKTIAVNSGIVYAGGVFSTAGGKQRANIAAIDASTGGVTDWDPGVNYPAITTIIPFGTKVMIGGGFTQFAYYSASHFAVAGVAITLPLQLVNFTAAAQSNDAIKLNWATVNEVNTARFTLQRAYDGVLFNDVTTITAGNNAFNDYGYTDAAFKAGNSLYYRLKIVDKDNSFTYSKTISLNLHVTAKDFMVYPNPAHDQIGLNVNSATNQKATLVITDMSGKIVQQQTVQLSQGNNNISVTLKAAAKGVYTAQLKLSDKSLSRSFLTY